MGDRLAVGATAEVYGLGDDRVVKLYFADRGAPATAAEREAARTRAVADRLDCVPATEGTVSVRGRHGVVFERVDGATLLADTLDRPWTLPRAATRLAELHARIHAVPAPNDGRLPRLRDRLGRRLDDVTGVPDRTLRQARETLEALPDGDALCHGDLHPGNVLLGDRGPVAIDWVDVSVGHPAADVARTSVLLRFSVGPDEGVLLRVARAWFRRRYLQRYCSLTGVDGSLVRRFEGVVALARVEEAVPEVDRLRSFATRRLDERRPDG